MASATLPRDLHVKLSDNDLDFLRRVAAANELTPSELTRILIRGMNPNLDLRAAALEAPGGEVVLSKVTAQIEERPRLVYEPGDNN